MAQTWLAACQSSIPSSALHPQVKLIIAQKVNFCQYIGVDWLDVIWPQKCANCGRLGSYICPQCEVGLWEEEQICSVCTLPSRFGQTHQRCHSRFSLDGLICLWANQGMAKKLISKANNRFLYDQLSELVRKDDLQSRFELGNLRSFLRQEPTLVPLPMQPAILKKQGFNPAEVIAGQIKKSFTMPYFRLLRYSSFSFDMQVTAVTDMPTSVLLVTDVWIRGSPLVWGGKVVKGSWSRSGVGFSSGSLRLDTVEIKV